MSEVPINFDLSMKGPIAYFAAVVIGKYLEFLGFVYRRVDYKSKNRHGVL